MKTVWTKGLTEEQKAEMEREFIEASLFKNGLIHILSEKRDTRIKEATAKSDYENASWAYKQADHIGFLRALDEILGLLQ